MYIHIMCAQHCMELLMYKTNITGTNIYTHNTIVNLLHVSASHRCHHQGVLLVTNVTFSAETCRIYTNVWCVHILAHVKLVIQINNNLIILFVWHHFLLPSNEKLVYSVLLLTIGTYRVAEQGRVFQFDDVGTLHGNIIPVCLVSLALSLSLSLSLSSWECRKIFSLTHFALYGTFLNTLTMKPIKVNLIFLTEY
jgi:hypothetical protein